MFTSGSTKLNKSTESISETETVSKNDEQKTESVKQDSKPKKPTFFGISYGLDESQDEASKPGNESSKTFTPNGPSKL